MSDYKHDTLTNRVTQLETRREDLDIDLGNTKEEIAELAEYEHLNDIYQQVFG